MRISKPSIIVPKEYLADQPEMERKWRVRGTNFFTRCIVLDQIFNLVAQDKEHFITLDRDPHIQNFDPELLAVSEIPIEIKALRERDYWSTVNLPGYKVGDKKKIEIRTENKIGKQYFEQVLKLGKDGDKTLERGEHKRELEGFGINLSVYPDKIEKEARRILGKNVSKPLVHLEGQSKPLLYHPGGRTDVLCEIKFDKTSGKTFDLYREKHAEVEIEIKEHSENIGKAEIEEIFDQGERVLLRHFGDDLQSIYESKVSGLFRHLAGVKLRDPKAFKAAFEALPGDRWAECNPF